MAPRAHSADLRRDGGQPRGPPRDRKGWTRPAFLFKVALVAITISGFLPAMYHFERTMMSAPGAAGAVR